MATTPGRGDEAEPATKGTSDSGNRRETLNRRFMVCDLSCERLTIPRQAARTTSPLQRVVMGLLLGGIIVRPA